MKKISRQTRLFAPALAALAAGALQFFILWGPACGQAAREAGLLRDHLAYAASQQDEMELIDWGRSLSGTFPGLALRARLDGKDLLTLGDPSQLPSREGAGFQFPDGWGLRRSIPLAAPSGGRLDLALRLPLSPDPWLPALGNALVVLVLTLLLLRTAPASGSARVPAADPPAASPVPLPPGPADPDPQAVLDVDEGYRLGSVSPRAALLLRQDREALLGRHLLDLAPHPALLEIMRSGLEGSVPDPFPPLPLAARVLPETNRWKIRLEPTQNGQKR